MPPKKGGTGGMQGRCSQSEKRKNDSRKANENQ